MDRFELVKRNTEEIVTEEGLRSIIDSGGSPSAYVGYEPSGNIHLGHLITVNKLIDMQQAGFKVIVLLADIHAHLNEKGSMEEVRETAEYNKRCFIAFGLEEDKAKFVLGSTFQLDADYMANVLKLATGTTLNRARRSMDEVSRSVENPYVSQMIYPLMQAVDIAILDVGVSVGGIDQRKIHMLARENLPKIGFEAPVCVHTPILTGLDGSKMSSSQDNFISLDDDEEAVEKKMESAFCPAGVVDNNPIIQIFRYHLFPRFEEMDVSRQDKYGGDVSYDSFIDMERDFKDGRLHPMDLKKAGAEYINRLIQPARSKI